MTNCLARHHALPTVDPEAALDGPDNGPDGGPDGGGGDGHHGGGPGHGGGGDGDGGGGGGDGDTLEDSEDSGDDTDVRMSAEEESDGHVEYDPDPEVTLVPDLWFLLLGCVSSLYSLYIA